MRGFALLVASAIVALSSVSALDARRSPEPQGKPNLDVRVPSQAADRAGFVMRAPTSTQLALAQALALEVPEVTLRWDGVSGSPKWIAAPTGRSLSPPMAGDPEKIARLFFRSHAALFGLEPDEVDGLRATSTIPAPDGGWHVRFTQTADELEVFDGRANVNLRADGSIRSVGSRLYSGVAIGTTAALEAVDAVRLAVRDVYPRVHFSEEVLAADADGARLTVFDAEGFGFPPKARLVLFPEADGVRLAWEVEVAEPTLYTSYRVVLDAVDGSLLFRENTTDYAEARYLNANAPEPETEEFEPEQHVLATIPSITGESPIGWISGDGTILEGNNAVSHLGFRLDPGLSDPAGSYDYPYNTTRAALVNAWWWANDAHDRYYDLGFTEAAQNFQQDNFGHGGNPGDPMQVTHYGAGPRYEAWYSSGTINFLWNDCRFCGDHDGIPEAPEYGTIGERALGFCRDLVYHEYTHGVSRRMIGYGCLTGIQSSALGEGWGDLLPASFFGIPSSFKYYYEGTGIGRDARHDLTYDDLCRAARVGCEEHADGMIWAGTLWDLRESMRALDPVDGLQKFHRIVIEGLASTVCPPTMLDALDGLLDADDTLYGKAHEKMIRNVFASRGMGRNASSTGENDTAPVTDYTVANRFACAPPATPSGLAAGAEGDNAIRLSYSASGAAAVEIWREDLDNPLDRAVRIAMTDDSATFLDDTVQGGKSYRYHIVALGDGGIVCRSDPSTTSDATATGSCDSWPVFDPGTTVAEDSGCAVTLSWSPADPGCPASGDPIFYNVYRAPTPGFAPSDRLLIGRTASTTFQDVPPDTNEYPFWYPMADTSYYLIVAQHGTTDDPPDHRDRGSAQLLRWVPGLPTSGRETVQEWDFETGAQGWSADNTNDPIGGWVVADPSPTYYAERLLAPDEAAGGSGQAWVTGDAGGPSVMTAYEPHGVVFLTSPTWDGTGGATILSCDYWNFVNGDWLSGLDLRIDNGTDQVDIGIVALTTVQGFETAGRHGWQRAEIDLAKWIAPTSSMSVTFVAYPPRHDPGEFGIDNVRIERATSCARAPAGDTYFKNGFG